MPTFTLLSGIQIPALRRIKSLRSAIGIGLFMLLGCCHPLWGAIINVPADKPTITAAIAAAAPGDEIVLAAGTYNEYVALNKNVIINGVDNATRKIQGNITLGAYFMLITGGGAGATVKNITFEKTDKTGVQNIIGLQANNVTFEDCVFQGQYVLGDPDVSRAFELAGSVTGFFIFRMYFQKSSPARLY